MIKKLNQELKVAVIVFKIKLVKVSSTAIWPNQPKLFTTFSSSVPFDGSLLFFRALPS